MTKDRIQDLKCKAVIFYIGLMLLCMTVWWGYLISMPIWDYFR